MGKSITPTYRVELDGKNDDFYGRCWDTKTYGRPTDANLEAYIRRCNDAYATSPHHEAFRGTRHYSGKIVRQRNGEVVASWSAPVTFQVD